MRSCDTHKNLIDGPKLEKVMQIICLFNHFFYLKTIFLFKSNIRTKCLYFFYFSYKTSSKIKTVCQTSNVDEERKNTPFCLKNVI